MKKPLSLILAALVALSLTVCVSGAGSSGQDTAAGGYGPNRTPAPGEKPPSPLPTWAGTPSS